MIEKWDTVAYAGYNAAAYIKYFFQYPIYHKYIKKNKQMKNKYQGERCFIVLNGPSIMNYDLSKLKDEHVFCVNYMYRSKVIDEIEPEFYCWSDGKIFHSENVKEDLEALFKKCPNAKYFFNMQYLDYVKELDDNIYITYNKHMPTKVKIRNKLDSISSNFMTVALYAMNVALYLGFKEIYVLGYDFTPGVMKHFADLGVENLNPSQKEKKEDVCGLHAGYVMAQYQNFYMASLAKKMGARIYNTNKESYVRSFLFIDYENIF